VINGDAPLSHDLLEVSIGHSVTDVKKHSVQDHGLGVVHAFKINRHSAQLAYSFPSKCSAASDGHLKAQKFATEPTGVYLEETADHLARKHGVTRPGSLGQVKGLAETTEALTRLAARTDIEGAVLTWADGHRVKWKTQDYHARHKVLGNIEHEKRVYQCWFDEIGDDTAASLGGERGRALLAFLEEIETAIATACNEIAVELAPLTDMAPADRAARVRDRFSGVRQSVAFSMLRGYDGREAVHRIAAGRIGSEEGRESLKRELGLPSWTIDIQALR